MLNQSTKGRFRVTYLNENEKLDHIFDINFIKTESEEEPENKHAQECFTPQPGKQSTNPLPKLEKEVSVDQNQERLMKKSDIDPTESQALNNKRLKNLHDILNIKYIQMISFHKEEMLRYIQVDTERQQKIMKVLEEISHYTKANILLEKENFKLRKQILEKDNA